MNLLVKALTANSVDEAVKPIQDALGIESGDLAGHVFSGLSWPAMASHQRAHLIGSWLKTEAIYANYVEDAQASKAAKESS